MTPLKAPKVIKAPPVAEPEPAPTELIETSEDVKQQEAGKRRRRSGRKRTVITGDLIPKNVARQTLVGRARQHLLG